MRKITAITIFALLLSLFTACGNKDKDKGDVYIPIYQFFSYNGIGEINYDGNDYENAEKRQNEIAEKLGDSYNRGYHKELIFNNFDAIYMNNGEFIQFTSEITERDFGKTHDGVSDVIDEIFYGQYEKTNTDKLNFLYNIVGIGDRVYNSYEYNTVNSIPKYEGQKELVNRINTTNKYNGIINGQFFTYLNGIEYFLYGSYTPPIAGLPIYILDNDNELLKDNDTYSYQTVNNIHMFENYIVAEQQGLSFESIKNHEEFSLKFEMPENATYYSSTEITSGSEVNGYYLYEDTVTKWNGIINFNQDNSFEATYNNEVISGTWTLFDDHILIMDSSNNKDVSYIAFLYLDFENEKIYVPGYAKCNKILDYMDMNQIKEISEYKEIQ